MTGMGQRGSALVPALAVLTTISLLSAMALMAGGADLALAVRLSRQRAAFYAAESALATALAALSGRGALPAATFLPPWPEPAPDVRRWREGAWSCASTARLVPDLRDADRDPATTHVLFDRSFGFRDAPRARGGFPLVQVLVSAAAGDARQAIVAEVAPVTCNPRLGSAWTAAGALELAGDVRIAGGDPVVVSRGELSLAGGAVVEGSGVRDPDLALPDDLLTLLAPGPTLPSLEDLPAPPAAGPLQGIVWSRGDYSGPIAGEGILIVHNPAFDPVKHEASRRAIEEGAPDGRWDPAYSHLDPARRPARLELLAGGSFRGLVVADTVGIGSAAASVEGALVTLSRSPHVVTGYAPLRVAFAEDALAAAGRGQLRHLVSFRPLAASEALLASRGMR